MWNIHSLKNFTKRNDGNSVVTIVIAIIFVLFMIMAIDITPEETDVNLSGDAGIVTENLQLEDINGEVINDASNTESNNYNDSSINAEINNNDNISNSNNQIATNDESEKTDEDNFFETEEQGKTNNNKTDNNKVENNKTEEKIDLNKLKTQELSKIPAYSNLPYWVVNNNIPFFYEADLITISYEKYSKLDTLGRCGEVIACIGRELMPTEERGNIGSVKPSGWYTVRYNGIDGNYLYNRCHLIGFQLTAENANEKNLITGTRYMNVQGMLPFENMVADYIKETNNHVLYRVTPIFQGNNLLASGVLMEAKSVEDNGSGIEFCVYCYNVQPGITINYKTGESSGPEYTGTTVQNHESNTSPSIVPPVVADNEDDNAISKNEVSYILNTNTKVFHYPSCRSVKQMSEKNKKQFNGTSNEAKNLGYRSCGNCNP